jgi:hypothetical protein
MKMEERRARLWTAVWRMVGSKHPNQQAYANGFCLRSFKRLIWCPLESGVESIVMRQDWYLCISVHNAC